MKVPFLDLRKINARFETEFQEVFKNFLDSGYYILGNSVAEFERTFAAYCGVKHCIGVGNGLDALRLILEGYKIMGRLHQGDEVLVAANTYIATILAIQQAGLKPVLVEAESNTYGFDVSKLKTGLTSKTKAIMPVHLYGQITNMDKVNAFAKENNLLLIEDAAQAHGSKFKVQDSRLKEKVNSAGNLGDAAGFSFYPTKNLSALGDGGAVTTNDDTLAEVVKMLRNYGAKTKYVNDYKGINSRLDELQAGLLLIKLKHLDADNNRRREIAKTYLTQLSNKKIILPIVTDFEAHVFHLFVVRTDDREAFQQYLTENGVGTLIHYPIPPHRQKAFSEWNQMTFPVTEEIHNTVISLPISPVMTADEVLRVIEVVNAY